MQHAPATGMAVKGGRPAGQQGSRQKGAPCLPHRTAAHAGVDLNQSGTPASVLGLNMKHTQLEPHCLQGLVYSTGDATHKQHTQASR